MAASNTAPMEIPSDACDDSIIIFARGILLVHYYTFNNPMSGNGYAGMTLGGMTLGGMTLAGLALGGARKPKSLASLKRHARESDAQFAARAEAAAHAALVHKQVKSIHAKAAWEMLPAAEKHRRIAHLNAIRPSARK